MENTNNLIEICKSGFSKMEKSPKVKKLNVEEISTISKILVYPQGGKIDSIGIGNESLYIVLDIELSFLEAFQVLYNIIQYSYSLPQIDFVRFEKISNKDMYAILAVELGIHAKLPFNVIEINFYPASYSFGVIATIPKDLTDYRYKIQEQWIEKFGKLFKVGKEHVSLTFLLEKE